MFGHRLVLRLAHSTKPIIFYAYSFLSTAFCLVCLGVHSDAVHINIDAALDNGERTRNASLNANLSQYRTVFVHTVHTRDPMIHRYDDTDCVRIMHRLIVDAVPSSLAVG